MYTKVGLLVLFVRTMLLLLLLLLLLIWTANGFVPGGSSYYVPHS
jgi:hypothetical protein